MPEEEEKQVVKEKVASTGGFPLPRPPAYLDAKPSTDADKNKKAKYS